MIITRRNIGAFVGVFGVDGRRITNAQRAYPKAMVCTTFKQGGGFEYGVPLSRIVLEELPGIPDWCEEILNVAQAVGIEVREGLVNE